MKKLLGLLSALILASTAMVADAAPRTARHHAAKATHGAKAHTAKSHAVKKTHAKTMKHKKTRIHRHH